MLKELILKNTEVLVQAMSDDFGHRSRGDSVISDILITIQGIDYCLKNLKDWMKPSKRHVELIYKPADNYVMYQPVGVFGLLGGKSPLILDAEMEIDVAESRFILGKTMNAGQTCVAPDYIFCPESKTDELCEEIQRRFSEMYPEFSTNEDWSSILDDRQYARIKGLRDDAVAKGAKALPLAEIDEETEKSQRKMLIR